MSVGVYPTLSLKELRSLAREALAKAARGVDPDAAKRQGDDASFGYLAVVERFMALHVAHNCKPRSAVETRRHLRDFGLVFKSRDVRTITGAEIVVILQKIVTKGRKDQQPFAAIRKFFNWCVEQQLLKPSPCAGIKPQNTVDVRTRVLADAEIAAVWSAALKAPFPYGPTVRLLLLTGQRLSEVGGMRWSELDLVTNTWTIPYARTKKRRKSDRKHDHVVPLSRQAVAVLRSLPVLQSEFVFPSTTNESAATGWRKKKDALDATLRKQGAVMPDWVLHDLRRTMATKMPDLDIPVEALSRILNHAPVGITDTNYNHNRYLKPMREALDRWGNRVAELTTPPPVAVPVAAAIPTTDDATFADLVTA